MLKKTMALMALMTLTACDYVQRADRRNEQNDRLYREAMDDYRAGRLDAALRGFEKAAAKNPSNASARFQLACLLQDSSRDFVGAYCAYREYLLQQPEGDKARLAKDRLSMCEKEMAKALASRFGLNGSGDGADELKGLQERLKDAESRMVASEKRLGESLARIRALSEERDRLLNVIKGTGAEEAGMAGKGADASRPPAGELRSLLEEDEEDVPTSSSLLPPQPVRPAEEKGSPKDAPAKIDRPAEYKVQEGDTLYGIAKRFYGKVSAWKSIREANKAIISTDGRLRAGDVLKLPRE